MSRRQPYSVLEVSRHCTADDCWLIAHGRVYDVTPMLKRHPAGAKPILRHAGRDATESYDFHTRAARKHWDACCIGRVLRENRRPNDWLRFPRWSYS